MSELVPAVGAVNFRSFVDITANGRNRSKEDDKVHPHVSPYRGKGEGDIDQLGIQQPLLLPGSKPDEVKDGVQCSFRLEEKQEDKTDSHAIQQCRKEQDSFEPVLHADVKA
ncbi:hypothetical protein D3C73_1496580 [compost metagenome]